MLNIINQILKLTGDGVLSESQVWFLEILSKHCQTASWNRSKNYVAAAGHRLIVSGNHRILAAIYCKEKGHTLGRCTFKACKNLLLHKNWIIHNLMLQQLKGMIKWSIDVCLRIENMAINEADFETHDDLIENYEEAYRINTKISMIQ